MKKIGIKDFKAGDVVTYSQDSLNTVQYTALVKEYYEEQGVIKELACLCIKDSTNGDSEGFLWYETALSLYDSYGEIRKATEEEKQLLIQAIKDDIIDMTRQELIYKIGEYLPILI